MTALAELERRIAALESTGREILHSSNNASIGAAGALEEPGTVPAGGAPNEALVFEAPGKATWALLKDANIAPAAAIAEAKLNIPEVVTKGTAQTISGQKTFTTGIKAQSVTEVEELGFKAGAQFALSEVRLLIGSASNSKLKQLKISGKNENYAGFEESPTDTAYAVIPEGGAAELTSAKPLSKHRLICLVNVSATETLTLLHEGAGLALNKFKFASGKNVKLEPGQTIWLWYTEGNAAGEVVRWRDAGGSSWNFAAKQHAAITNPIEELKAVREKLEEALTVLKEHGLTA